MANVAISMKNLLKSIKLKKPAITPIIQPIIPAKTTLPTVSPEIIDSDFLTGV